MDLSQEVEDDLTRTLTNNESIGEENTPIDHSETTEIVDNTTQEELPPAEKSKVGAILLLMLAVVLFLYFKNSKS
jgi:hypothetical protein